MYSEDPGNTALICKMVRVFCIGFVQYISIVLVNSEDLVHTALMYLLVNIFCICQYCFTEQGRGLLCGLLTVYHYCFTE